MTTRLRRSYRWLAPIYDAVVALPTRRARAASLSGLADLRGGRILLPGIGTGLDCVHLPAGPVYYGVDATPAMLHRARASGQRHGRPLVLTAGDAMALPFPDAGFDAVVLHLILAVVPHPERALAEARRVCRPGGRLLILDKFLRPGQRAPVRRALSPLLGAIATRTDVVLESLLAGVAPLELESDLPALARGWFRRVTLRRPGGS